MHGISQTVAFSYFGWRSLHWANAQPRNNSFRVWRQLSFTSVLVWFAHTSCSASSDWTVVLIPQTYRCLPQQTNTQIDILNHNVVELKSELRLTKVTSCARRSNKSAKCNPQKANPTEWCCMGCWRGTVAVMNEWTLTISHNSPSVT